MSGLPRSRLDSAGAPVDRRRRPQRDPVRALR
jgi:hypothetical protein